MAIDRRKLLLSMAGVGASLALPRIALAKGGAEGAVYKPTRQSLRAYRVPEWFRDAKFGVWSHWGPQSAIEDGDWYARNMYMQGSDQYKYHCATYGHPTKFGYKDLVGLWRADKWDPDGLMDLYKKAGARYFVSMGVHHDNFDLWDSKHTRWNAARMGPKKDIVGLWRKAALKHGLRFGVSEHLWISYKWFATSHGADKTGPLAGVPYDGADAAFADLYHDADVSRFGDRLDWNDDGIPEAWKKHYLARMVDLIDQHKPDLLYTDGHLPFEDYGLQMVAHLYNTSAAAHGGQVEAVYNSKENTDCAVGTCAVDHERGVADGISAEPWQTDTCIGEWHYKRGAQYKTAKKVIDQLVDIVSKNGNLLLNFPLPNSGELDAAELRVLDGITKWMQTNGEGVYATRPWKVYGEGPAMSQKIVTGNFNEDKLQGLTAADIRFTSKGKIVYAFVMGATDNAVVRSLGANSEQTPGRIARVSILGRDQTAKWTQENDALRVAIPPELRSDIGLTLKIELA